MSDIMLDEGSEQVTVQCSNLNVRGHDLILDSPARRKPRGPQFRRALVHDFNDGLSINFAGDYPGGVTVGGAVDFLGMVRFRISHAHETAHLLLDERDRPDEVVTLSDVVRALRAEIAELRAQLAHLQPVP